MAKFVMECPKCGRYTEGSTSFFASRKIKCSCGYLIDVKTDKLSSRTCAHCGNNVVFDQSKGNKAKCPVCGEPINTQADKDRMIEFSCEQCGVRLLANKHEDTYTCLVCGHVNKIQERRKTEEIRKDGLASIVKYEGDNSTFIWKHPIEDFNLGSQLIVHESQEAIFFRDGQALDLFGPGRYTLETQQLPLLEKAYELPTDTEGTFHSEVYFINKTIQMGLKWGTPDKVRFIDPLTSVPVEIGASGEMNMQVADSRKLLIKLVGTMSGIAWEDAAGFTKSLQSAFRPLIVTAVKTNLISVIKEQQIDLLEIDQYLDSISESLREKVNSGFQEYGLFVPQFYVTSIVLPENDPNFRHIRELHTIVLQTRVIQAEAAVKTAKAQSEASYRTAQEKSRAVIESSRREAELEIQTTQTEIAKQEAARRIIQAQADAEATRLSGIAEATVMQAKGYTEKDVLQAEVQKAYAEGIGNMGGGSDSGGGAGGGIVNEILGLGVGMAAAGSIMPQLGNIIQGIGTMGQTDTTPKISENPDGLWNCSCGQSAILGNFCPNCGSPKPARTIWNCSCGQMGMTGNFCSNCGAKRPEPTTWDCTCGRKNITGNFCDNCGKKRGE